MFLFNSIAVFSFSITLISIITLYIIQKINDKHIKQLLYRELDFEGRIYQLEDTQKALKKEIEELRVGVEVYAMIRAVESLDFDTSALEARQDNNTNKIK
jgi:hypothetical protein